MTSLKSRIVSVSVAQIADEVIGRRMRYQLRKCRDSVSVARAAPAVSVIYITHHNHLGDLQF